MASYLATLRQEVRFILLAIVSTYFLKFVIEHCEALKDK